MITTHASLCPCPLNLPGILLHEQFWSSYSNCSEELSQCSFSVKAQIDSTAAAIAICVSTALSESSWSNYILRVSIITGYADGLLETLMWGADGQTLDINKGSSMCRVTLYKVVRVMLFNVFPWNYVYGINYSMRFSIWHKLLPPSAQHHSLTLHDFCHHRFVIAEWKVTLEARRARSLWICCCRRMQCSRSLMLQM